MVTHRLSTGLVLICCTLLFLVSPFLNRAQCTGSVGNYIVNNTFGSGVANPGPALPTTATSMPYSNIICTSDGNYTIANYASGCFSGNWHTTTDHTGDPNGYFMLINASYTPDVFYTQTIDNLCSGVTYSFSAWVTNLCSSGTILPNISFSIETSGGTVLGSYSSGDIPNSTNAAWHNYSMTFTVPNAVTTVILKIRNNAPGGFGNDLGLDDITFRPIGPQITFNSSFYCLPAPVPETLAAVVSNCYTTTEYQWQISTDLGVNWSNVSGANATTYLATPPGPGVYFYRLCVASIGNISSSKCNTYSSNIVLVVNTPGMLHVPADTTICIGDIATLHTSCPNIVSYIWNPTTGLSCPTCAVTTVSPTSAIQYTVTTTDTWGCPNQASTYIAVTTKTQSNLVADTVDCSGYRFQLDDTGATIFSWSPPTGLNSTTIGNPIAILNETTSYTVITQKGSCVPDTNYITINVYPTPQIDLGNDTFFCLGNTITLQQAEPIGISYLWNNGSKDTSLFVTMGGIYYLTVTSPKGCLASDTVKIAKIQPPKISLGPDVNPCIGDSLLLPISVDSGGSAHPNYFWSTGYKGANIKVNETGDFWVIIVNECGNAEDTMIARYDNCNIWIPTAFTPNGDGRNDIIRVLGTLSHFTDFSFGIYNRFGQRVFYTTDIFTGWDGKFNNVPQELGTYFYMIKYKLENKAEMMKGDFQLIR